MSILIFIIILLALVLVHEFGHFIVAKRAGIRVDEFAFGFPPRLLSKKFGETRYSFNLLPIGGYVKIFGENPDDVARTGGADSGRSFIAQSRAIQALVVVAGVVFNLLFAWLLFTGAYMAGVPASTESDEKYPIVDARLIVTGVEIGSPAERAGLASGDTLKRLSDGERSVDVVDGDAMIAFISPREGKPVTLTYERANEERSVEVVPVLGITETGAAIGIYMDSIGTLKLPPHVALWRGLQKTYEFTVLTVVGITQFLAEALTGRSDFQNVAGPVGIVKEVGNAAGMGASTLIVFTALISINLAVINLIPFPALDGGRLLFILIEALMRRPIAPRVANSLNIAGFALLMLLMIVVTYHDIAKLVQ